MTAPNLENCIQAPEWEADMTQMPLLDFVQLWLTTFKKTTVRHATYDRLVTSIQALKRYAIAEKPIGEITFFDIQGYINELTGSGYGMSTIKKQVRIVTAPLKQAAAMRIIPTDPSIGTKMPAKANVAKADRDIFAYTDHEQRRLRRITDQSDKAGYLCAAFMIETGLRAGEALALRWTDVDILRRRLRVRATVVNLANKKQSYVQDTAKSESSNRVIPLSQGAIDILRKLGGNDETCTDGWIFVNHGDRLSYEALRYQTQCLCKEAGVKYHGEHIFRHTFATNCYYRGVDIKILSRLLGHADVNITYNVYVNLYGDGFDEMLKAIDF